MASVTEDHGSIFGCWPGQGFIKAQKLPMQKVTFVHNTVIIQEKGKGQYNLATVSLQNLSEDSI